MPFTYSLPVPEIPKEALDESQSVRLIRFRAKEGEWVEAGTQIAKLEASQYVIWVLANGSGILAERVAAPGAILRVGDELAIIRADGESIPYDRPYSVAQIKRKRRFLFLPKAP